ncbi:hypothetical protein Taro_032899 [Colocasia esculenta]|uniref:Uncharacterized protein n=1 Tax=Colocasia esculenta TaxID=4460 RepID=A0A843W089_COLES|nr:hypothetical protein [Colocasia esculenta]
MGLRGGRRGPLETLEEFYTRVRGLLDLGGRSEERGGTLGAPRCWDTSSLSSLAARGALRALGDFTPFLQIWGYTRFPMGRGTVAE